MHGAASRARAPSCAASGPARTWTCGQQKTAPTGRPAEMMVAITIILTCSKTKDAIRRADDRAEQSPTRSRAKATDEATEGGGKRSGEGR